jgi:hypothetical protein
MFREVQNIQLDQVSPQQQPNQQVVPQQQPNQQRGFVQVQDLQLDKTPQQEFNQFSQLPAVPQRLGALPNQISPEKIEQDVGFLKRTAEDLRQRGAQLADIFNASNLDKQTRGETVFQTIGTQFAALGDVTGQGVISALNVYKDLIPENERADISNNFRRLLETEPAQKVISALNNGVESYAEFATNNPRAARNLEAGFNIISVVVPLNKIGLKNIKNSANNAKNNLKELTNGVIENIPKNKKEVKVKVPLITSDELKVLSSNKYKFADEVGGLLKPQVSNNILEKGNSLRDQTELGEGFNGKTGLTDALERLQVIKDKPISLQAAQEIDEGLGDTVEKLLENGKFTKDAKKVLELQGIFRDAIENASLNDVIGTKEGFDAFKEGRALWSASKRLEDIEDILYRAEFADNPSKAIKAGFKKLLTNQKNLRGYTPKEIKLMERAAKTGIVSDLLRVTLGSRLLPIITTASGGGLGASAASSAASIASRSAADALAVRKAQNVSAEIIRRTLQQGGTK